jgi:hypothetical protein
MCVRECLLASSAVLKLTLPALVKSIAKELMSVLFDEKIGLAGHFGHTNI